MTQRDPDFGPKDPVLRAFAEHLATLPRAESDAIFANFLRELGASKCADIWAAGGFPPLSLLFAELDAAKRQDHADAVCEELLADVEIRL